jgi:GT2 family glycosyltransferase
MSGTEEKGSDVRKPMDEAMIAFVILTWNSAQYVRKCLDSVTALHFEKVRVYVVDNGSNDETIRIIERYTSGNINVSLIRLSTNFGTTKSRNMVLRKISADVDYICVLDSDTEVNNEAFEILVQKLVDDREESIGLIGPTMRNREGVRQLSGRNLPTMGIKMCKAIPVPSLKQRGAAMEVPDAQAIDGLQDVGYLLSACWLMPSSTLSKVGLLDERIFYAPEDVDYCVRVHQAGLRVAYCADAAIIHDYQRISQKKIFSIMNMKHFLGLAYYFKKYRYLFNADAAVAKREK